ncbi:Uncharacterized conserved protein, FlaG/YvyC family [Anaerovirgula multivorans]|uniref:Uncharacterized conserved protein, FlaG/YvyC family n=1 Tax=Anaerovirgula multivorans TaxID=312168 RepID=A0A239II52_9FIRM|nr:hypothetical protein [Anaerovirgula multivorans]SNS92693.1 Uncharacterized conserved protein, FlaG/YvyC family [Anaerovirgula multivorans]
MKKIFLIVAIIIMAIFTGCSNTISNASSEDEMTGRLGNNSVEESVMNETKPVNEDRSSIYEWGDGKILIKLDKLYLLDIKTQKILSEEPLKGLNYIEWYYTTNDGYCLIDTYIIENDGIIDDIIYNAYFYNKDLEQIKEMNLNELLDSDDILAIAISKSGNKIAYTTFDGLFVYDMLKQTKQSILNLNSENFEINKGFNVITNIAFFNQDKKIAFIGYNDKTTFGTINIDGSELVDHKATLPRLEHMDVSDTYLSFSEGLYPRGHGVPAGEVILINNATNQMLKHTLQDKNEGSNVFLSEEGKYFATSIQKGSNEIIIRIYDSQTGELIREIKRDFAGKPVEKYRRTYIKLFDSINTFIAVSTFFDGHEPMVVIDEF